MDLVDWGWKLQCSKFYQIMTTKCVARESSEGYPLQLITLCKQITMFLQTMQTTLHKSMKKNSENQINGMICKAKRTLRALRERFAVQHFAMNTLRIYSLNVRAD